jgi:hypothetical protein
VLEDDPQLDISSRKTRSKGSVKDLPLVANILIEHTKRLLNQEKKKTLKKK